MSVLPNFLIIGAPRSGTTFLAKNLATHPEIFLPHFGEVYSTGDIHFFDVTREEGRRNYDRGLSWYKSYFSGANGFAAVGEKTADYLADPLAPSLVKRCLGNNIRLIAIVRDPVIRAYSHYWHYRPGIPISVDFEKAFFQGPELPDMWIKESGYYFRNLQRYLDLFSSEQILVLVNEDLSRTPQNIFGRVCSFLRVSSKFEFPFLHSRINISVTKGLPYYMSLAAGAFRRHAPAVFERIKGSPGVNGLKKIVARSRGNRPGSAQKRWRSQEQLAYESMDEDLRDRIRDVYRADVGQLSDWLKRDLESLWWSED